MKKIKNILLKIYYLFGKIYLYPILRYESKHPPFPSHNERAVEYSFAFNHISKLYPKTLLDIGTGSSAFPDLVANCGIGVTAIDKIRGYWKTGFFNRHFLIRNDDIICPRIKDRFDVVTCISVLEHIPDHKKAMRYMCELINPKGYLILTFPYNEHYYIKDIYKDRVPSPNFVTQIFSRKQINSWLEDSGMEIIEQKCYNMFIGGYWSNGDIIIPPVETDQYHKHHLTCILLRKQY